MLFHFFTSFIDQYSFLNVFKYLTFRTGLSVVTSLIIVFLVESYKGIFLLSAKLKHERANSLID